MDITTRKHTYWSESDYKNDISDYYLIIDLEDKNIKGIFDYNKYTVNDMTITQHVSLHIGKKESESLILDKINVSDVLLINIKLHLFHNEITETRNAPNTCVFLGLHCNRMTEIKNIPDACEELDLRDNCITEIKNIPSNCYVTRLGDNNINKISQHIPVGMHITGLDCEKQGSYGYDKRLDTWDLSDLLEDTTYMIY